MRIKYLLTFAFVVSFFTSFAQVPNCATTTSPLNGITAITTSGATLRWNAPIGGGTVTGYRLYLGTDAAATNVFNGVSIGNVLTTTLGTLLCNQTYFWQVVPFNITGSATGCAISRFSTSLSTNTVGVFASYNLNFNGTSTVTDFSGNGRNGALINAPTSVQDRNGNANSAYYFNGVNQEIQPSYARLTPPTSFTISLWFNTTATVGSRLIGFGNTSSGSSSQTDRYLFINNSGGVTFFVFPGGNQTISSPSSYNDGKWHNIVATLGTTSGFVLYVDGIQVARNASITTAFNSYSSGNTGFWRIGNDATTGITNPFFNGALDDVIIYNRELSPLESAANYGAFYNAQGCTGGSLILSAASIVGSTYNWSGPNSFASTLRTPTVTGGVSAANSGIYTATVNYGNSCSNVFNTTVISNPIISNNSISGSFIRCISLPSTLTGSVPTGGDGNLYTYIWQSSTTSSTAGFVPASGTNTNQNYTTTSFTVPTWLRRIVFSGGCSDISQPVLVSPAITTNTITTFSTSICENEIPNVFTGTAAAGGGGSLVYQWVTSTTSGTVGFSPIASTNVQTYTPGSGLGVTSWFRRVVTSAGFCVDSSAAVKVNVISSSSIPGNPLAYGNGIWNVYGYNVNNTYPNPNSSFVGYSGFYTTTALWNFDTAPLWGNNTSPGPMNNVSTYQGCFTPASNMSFAVKGTNIVTSTGIYRLDLNTYDDATTFRLNGTLYFSDPSWFQGVARPGVYIGPISPSDLFDFTVNQGGGGVNLRFTLTQLTSTPGPLIAGSITGSDVICAGNTPNILSSVTVASGACTPIYTWQISTDSTSWTNLSNSNVASYTPLQSVFQKTWYRRAATDVCGSTTVFTLPVVINMLTPPGNITVYGINMWNAYAFADNVWGTYSGQWTEPGLNFNATTTYGNNNPPSDPSNTTYQGCIILNQYYSTNYKREGFPSGNYIITLTSDDYVDVRINGTMVYQNTGCLCGTTVAAWTGPLGPTDKVDFYQFNNAGPGYLRVNLLPVTITSSLTSGIIGYDRIQCSGNVPVPLANVTASWNVMTRPNNTTTWLSTDPANNACYVNPNNGYQWRISTDLITWTNISGATASTYSPSLPITTTTYFIRIATDVCGNTATSNFVTISVGGAVTPTPTPTVGGTYGYGDGFWNVYGYGVQGLIPTGYVAFRNTNPSTLNNYAGFYQDSTLYNFDTRRQWGTLSGPSAAVSFPANYNGCVINTQLWAIWAKRTNIPSGTYTIDVGVDDDADLFIDNARVFNGGCCGNSPGVWTGTLSGSTLIDVRGSNGNGPGYLTFTLTTANPTLALSGGTISSDQSVCSGTVPAALTNTLTATSSCYLSYQWQMTTNTASWANISSATTSSYTPTLAVTTTTYFRRNVFDACGLTSTSNIVTITVYPVLSVGTASSNVSTSCSPAAIQLQLNTVTGGSGTFTYQWQSSVVSTSAGFTNYTPGVCGGPFGANLLFCNGGPSITTTSFFRVIVSSGNCNTVASNAFTFTVLTSVGIATQPVNISACVGSNAFLTTSATGLSPTYTWQQCLSPCTTPSWSNLVSNATFSGVNANQLTITGINASTGSNTFRVLYGSSCGPTLTSNSVNISLNSPPTINSQPASATICGSGVVTFNVGASGTALIYQWQASTALGGVYSNVSNGTPSGVTYSGGNSSSLTVSTTGVVNYFYRALVNSASCSGISTTSGVALVVNPVIVGNTFTTVSNLVCSGATTTLLGSLPTGGSGSYSYQWRTSPDNLTWTNATGGTSPTTQNYRPTAAISANTFYQRVISSGACTSTSPSDFISIVSTPVFTLQPVSITTCPGNTVLFTTNATSTGTLNYQWFVNTGPGFTLLSVSPQYPNVTSATLTVVSFPLSFLGYQYRVQANNGCVNVNSNTVSLTNFTFPTIVSQPTSTITCALGNLTIPYTVTGFQTAIQWQTNPGTGWTDMSNFGVNGWQGTFQNVANRTNQALTFTGNPTFAVNGNQYRFVITGLCTSSISSAITVTVLPAIANNSIGVTQNICTGFPTGTLIGSNLTGGNGNYTYQWFSSVDNSTFNSIPGANFKDYYAGVLTTTSWFIRAANSFNCVTRNSQTPNLQITISPATNFVIEPTDQFACNGTNALFTSSAVGLAIVYKWQSRTSSVSSFTDVVGGADYPGYSSSFNASNRNLTYLNPPASVSGMQFRCIAQGGCNPPFDTSAVVNLYINPVPFIVTQPSPSISCFNSTANFSVIATAAGALNYRWQVNPGTGWSNTATVSPYFNSTTSTLGVLASFSVSGLQYRSILTLGSCVVTSTGAALTVNSLVGITSQPTAVNVCEGSNTSFSVTATGTGLNYSWSTSANGGTSWTTLSNNTVYSGVTSATLSITSTPSNLNSNLYRVIVGGSCNPSVTSTGVILAVNANPTIVSNPVDRLVCSGGNTFFTVSTVGTNVTYQWQLSTNSGSSWATISNGSPYSQATTSTLSITGATVSMLGYQYRALITSTCFPTVTSSSATLTAAFASTWIGGISSNWFTVGNWCSTVPTANDDVLIQNTSLFMPVITGTGAICRDIVINNGASLTINSSNSLGVYGSWQNDGTYNANSSSINFLGTVAQFISGASGSMFNNITVANSVAGVSLLSNQSITGTLTLSDNANFTTTGFNFILVSSASNTARIAAIPNSAVFTGNITMQRFIPAKPTLRLMSSAVNGSTLTDWRNSIPITGIGGSSNGFDPASANINTVWYYDETINAPTTYEYVGAPNINMPLSIGRGYRVFIRGERSSVNLFGAYTVTPVVMSVTNPPNMGTIALPVTYTNYNAQFRDGTNLVGNPYPSEINWDAAGWTKSNIDNALYMWDPNLGVNGQYFSYVAGVASPARTNPGIIASSQAFFVKASAPASITSLIITESVKTVAGHTANFRGASESVANLLRLKLMDSTTLFDETAIRFKSGSSTSFDKEYDAYKMYNSTLNIYSNPVQGLDLSINTMPISDYTILPLSVYSNKKRQHKIMFGNMESFEDSVTLYLKDKYLNTYTQVKNGDTYNFLITTDAKSQGTDRFELTMYRNQIVTNQSQTGIGSIVPMMKVYPNPVLTNSVTLDLYNLEDEKVKVTLMDMNGNLWYSQYHSTDRSKYFSTELNQFSTMPSGVYMISVMSSQFNSTQKVIVIK